MWNGDLHGSEEWLVKNLINDLNYDKMCCAVNQSITKKLTWVLRSALLIHGSENLNLNW